MTDRHAHTLIPMPNAAPEPFPGAEAMLGRVVLLVRDYEAALAFYVESLGAGTLFDQSVAGRRFLHISFPGQPDAGLAPVGLWLVRAEGDDLSLVGRQTGGQPFLVLYTGDLDAALERFSAAGGEIRRPVRSDGEARFAHVADLYGNEIVLVQLGAGETPAT